MTRIPLGLGPSLHQLRSRSLCLVRGLHSYYGSGFQRLLTIAFRPALRFDVRYLIWEVSLSVSGGIGSPRKTTCGPRSVRLYHPYKVADRRPPAARMSQREFANQKALIEYAEQNGLFYEWQGSQAFAKRQRGLSSEQYEIVEVRTSRGMNRAMLFSKAIIQAE